MKRGLRIFLVLLLLPVLPVFWLAVTESGLNQVYQHAKQYLPDGLRIEKIEGRLIGPMTLSGVDYRQDALRIHARQLVVDWHPGALLTANIDIQLLHIQSLQIIVPATDTTQATAEMQLPDVYLPWRMSLQDVQIDELTIQQAEQTFALQQIYLSASSLFSRIQIKQLSARADDLAVEIKGELQPVASYPHKLDIDWQYTLPDSAMIQGKGELAGSLQQTHLKQQLTGPLVLTLNAELNDLLGKINWLADVDVSALDLAKLSPDWPAITGQLKLQGRGDLDTADVSGHAGGYYAETGSFNADFKTRVDDTGVQIEQLSLQLPGHKTRVSAQGQWLFGNHEYGDIKLALNWQNLRWPMQGTPWFDSARGQGNIEGTLDHYRFTLATESPWPEAAPSYWTARAEGNADGLRFEELRIRALGGEAALTGQLKWSPVLSWQAEGQISNANPAERWPDWPGKLNATLHSTGRLHKDQLIADMDVSELNGLLRGYPVTLRSRVTWRDEGLDIAQFDFHSGTSVITAQGRVGTGLNLDWRLEADNLSELYPQWQGKLRALGQLSGRQDAPLIKAAFEGQDLSWPDYRIGKIEGAVTLDLLHWQHIDIRLLAQALDLNGYALQSVDMSADTGQLQAHIVSQQAQVDLALQGERNAQGWQGHIVRADIRSKQFDNWQLKAPAVLAVRENTLQLENVCWGNSQQASLCGSVKRDHQSWHSSIQLEQLPLLLFSPWLPPDLKLEGVVDAQAELALQNPDSLLGSVRLSLPPGVVSYALVEGERDQWTYRGGMLDVSLTEQGVTAASEITLQNGDHLRVDASLPGAQLLALNPVQQKIIANAQLSVHDLGLVEALLPEIQDLKGVTDVTLTVDGTLAHPHISGQADLHDGEFRLPRLGLSIDQINLQGQSEGFDRLRYTLGARSGEGRFAIQGQTWLDSATGWLTELDIRGENVEVARIPEARVQISPDLQVKIHDHAIRVAGKVDIPVARLQPKDVTLAVTVSDDAVMVGGEQPPEPKWAITSQVRVSLGDKVNFFGFGFEGRLAGSLLLEDEPGQLTKATGEISVPEGRYRAYGQRLDVERGRLIFAGGPLTNPGLDLRAVRQINAITAGVRVKGSLTEPQLELFSSPAMGQTDMLSYLILGRPMETATGEEGAMMAKAALAVGLSGGDRLARVLGDRFGLDEMRVESSEGGDQASLVVGRYLSPKVYVSYGVGLIESINTFTVRYQISDQWQIKAESGEAQGADIFYTIDR